MADPTLDREEIGQISGLVGHPGYQALLKRLAGVDQALIDSLAVCDDDRQLVPKVRFWQAYHHLYRLMATEPVACLAHAEALAENDQAQLQFLFRDELTHHSV